MRNTRRTRIAKMLVKAAKIIVADYAYDDIRRYVVNKRSLINDVRRYGVSHLKGSGYVLHHIRADFGSHFIEAGHTYPYYKKLLDVLKHYNESDSETAQVDGKALRGRDPNEIEDGVLYRALQEEMDNLMLLPRWYHDDYHTSGKTFSTKEECYRDLDETILKNDPSKKTEEKDIVEAIQFNGTTIQSALGSLVNLATISNDRHKAEIIGILHEAFKKIYKKNLNIR